MAAKRKKSSAKRARPKGKTVHVRAYCRNKAGRFVRSSGKNQRGEDMPF